MQQHAVVHRLLVVVASLVEHGLSSAGSVVMAHRLSCSEACGIFLDQGSNPCPLHWQADSYLLDHHGNPIFSFLLSMMIENLGSVLRLSRLKLQPLCIVWLWTRNLTL